MTEIRVDIESDNGKHTQIPITPNLKTTEDRMRKGTNKMICRSMERKKAVFANPNDWKNTVYVIWIPIKMVEIMIILNGSTA
jgi:hypothetical protein